MRLRSHPRAERLLGRIPRFTALSAAELVLLALIAIQAARLIWVLATPVDPVGDYRGSGGLVVPATALGEFDPFFRLTPAGAPVVTALNLKLYGVREDRATGRGSAIIGLPDGNQLSFAVGEEVMPGVVLAQVGFDNVTINRNGTPEQIFLDQSAPAPAPAPPGAAVPVPPPTVTTAPAQPAPPVVAPAPAAPPVRLQPRMRGGRAAGLIVSPGAGGAQALAAAGFQPGDVIISVNGQPVSSIDQARAIAGQSSGPATIIVERGGRRVPISVRLDL